MPTTETSQPSGEIVIRGITAQGRTFRPSDWAERLASIVAHVGADHRVNYSPNVRPVMRDGVSCLVIARCLEGLDARLYRFLLDFAHDNELEVHAGRAQPRR